MELIEYRSLEKLSCEDVAAWIGKSKQQVSRYERGEQYPPPYVIDIIEKKTGGKVREGDFRKSYLSKKPIKKPLTRPVSKRNTKITGVNAQEEGRV